jgi:signal transduction histidine kinase
MFRLPNRAPISSEEIRRPFHILRGSGASVFLIAAVVGYIQTGDSATLLLVIPSGLVLGDALYRLRTNASSFVALLIDTTALFFALALRGPTPTINAVVVIYLLVASSLVPPMARAAIIVGYAAFLWIAIAVLQGWTTDGLVGVITRGGLSSVFDTVTVIVMTISVAAIMLGAINALLRSQDQQAEALAQEKRAVELKNEFVSMVSHELRTPLTGIAGFTDTLNENWANLPSREVDEFLAIMGQETDHLVNLVEDILVIPRLEAGQLRLTPVNLDLATETHRVASMIFADAADYSVTIPANVMVHADQTRLRQILRNLIENAQKYGGDQVLIEGELQGPGIYEVSVSDNGEGVAAHDRERIFKHFEQLSTGDGRLEQGVGLGLPIARTLSRAMGGDLWYEDRFPVGARFSFTIKLASERGTASDPPSSELSSSEQQTSDEPVPQEPTPESLERTRP